MKPTLDNLKEIVKGTYSNLLLYRSGVIYYEVSFNEEMYQFPVPLEDVGNASLNKVEKSMTLMRYIRKALKNNEFVKIH